MINVPVMLVVKHGSFGTLAPRSGTFWHQVEPAQVPLSAHLGARSCCRGCSSLPRQEVLVPPVQTRGSCLTQRLHAFIFSLLLFLCCG